MDLHYAAYVTVTMHIYIKPKQHKVLHEQTERLFPFCSLSVCISALFSFSGSGLLHK